VKNRSFVFIAILLFVALFTWSISNLVGSAVKGGNEEFRQWRAENVGAFYFMWGVEVVAIGVPLLWYVGRRLSAQQTERDEKLLAARGVGRIAVKALQGDEGATTKLIKLLDDREPAVRYQSARALVMVDQPEPNKELFRKVSYWPGDQKTAMVDVLLKMKDMRARKLLKVLAQDRSPIVSRGARNALAMTAGRATDMADIIARRKREAAAREAKAARKAKRKPAAGAATDQQTAPEATAEQQAPPVAATVTEAPEKATPAAAAVDVDAAEAATETTRLDPRP
jgi:hypothetical protein